MQYLFKIDLNGKWRDFGKNQEGDVDHWHGVEAMIFKIDLGTSKILYKIDRTENTYEWKRLETSGLRMKSTKVLKYSNIAVNVAHSLLLN